MARDLSNEVEKFFRNSNPYIRKKAALCAVRLVRKAPELVEEYIPGTRCICQLASPVLVASLPLIMYSFVYDDDGIGANGLLNDSNHAVQLSGIQLVIDMVKIDPSCVGSFRKTVPTLVRLLKNLLLGGYVNEYDVVGITDPFLQTKIIHLLRLLGTGNAECSELMNDILAQVTIQPSTHTHPNSVIDRYLIIDHYCDTIRIGCH
jgi:AP-1 complex subunit gamma-1